MDTIFQDVWYSLRQFGRRPGFAAVAVLSLGMAIGANSLIYGLVEGRLSRHEPMRPTGAPSGNRKAGR